MTVLDTLSSLLSLRKTSVTVWVAWLWRFGFACVVACLAEIQKQTPFHLKALHINHGLSVMPLQWSLHCKNICEQLDIPFHVQAFRAFFAKPARALKSWLVRRLGIKR